MRSTAGDHDLFARITTELHASVIGDILDTLGAYHRFLPQPIKPLREAMKLAGRAMPVVMSDVHGPQEEPFGKLTEALDQLREGEVYLAGGGTMRCAYWGEILTATARMRGAAGAVVDGFHRDTRQVLEQSWPVFSRGSFAQDASVRTRVAGYRCPIEIGGVWIEPGDLVVADLDGVVIVPRRHEAEVIERALEKVRTESRVRKEIEQGSSSAAAFARHRVL